MGLQVPAPSEAAEVATARVTAWTKEVWRQFTVRTTEAWIAMVLEEGKQQSPQATAAARARALHQRNQMREQVQDDFNKQHHIQGQVAPVMTSADRAYAAAQAQVEAHKKLASAQHHNSEQQHQIMTKGSGKMRARPRIRNLSNGGQSHQQSNQSMSFLEEKDKETYAYEAIIAQGSVSRVQQRAEGPAASLDRVRGLEAGGNKSISPQQSGLGGMNRPNQPTRSRPQPHTGPRPRKNPLSPEGLGAGPFPNVNPNDKEVMGGLKKLYTGGT